MLSLPPPPLERARRHPVFFPRFPATTAAAHKAKACRQDGQAELPLVVRDQGDVHRQGTCGDERVQRSDRGAGEVNRRKRRAKSDGLDAGKLLTMLMRFANGESKAWSVVRAPSVQDEDDRQLHRELLTLKNEQTRHVNRIKGLLAACGLRLPEVGPKLVERQIDQIERERTRLPQSSTSPNVARIRQLMDLRAIGVNSAWLFVSETFGWRAIRNRRELASLCGLAPTPYQSGGGDREQGISKAGNWRMRRMAVEIAWCWMSLSTPRASACHRVAPPRRRNRAGGRRAARPGGPGARPQPATAGRPRR